MRSQNRQDKTIKYRVYRGITMAIFSLVVLFLIGVLFPNTVSDPKIPKENIVMGNETIPPTVTASPNASPSMPTMTPASAVSTETSVFPSPEETSLQALAENVPQVSDNKNTQPSKGMLQLDPEKANAESSPSPEITAEEAKPTKTPDKTAEPLDTDAQTVSASAEPSVQSTEPQKNGKDTITGSDEQTAFTDNPSTGDTADQPPSLLEIISRSIFSYKTLLSREMPFIYGTEYIAQDIESLIDEQEMAPEEIPEEIKLEISKIKNEKEPSHIVTGNGAQVLIYHTHTLEAYRQVKDSTYEETSRWRTKDQSKSVVHIGDLLQKELETYGFDVLHDKTNHEPPDLNTAYSRSLSTIKKYMQNNKTLRVFIDLHRDASTNKNDFVEIDGKRCAKVMFVVGMGKSSSIKLDWKQNYKLAQTITDKLNKIHPGLAKEVRVKEIRTYNQYVSDLCMLVEVGHNANTLEEAENTVPYLAKALNEVIKVQK